MKPMRTLCVLAAIALPLSAGGCWREDTTADLPPHVEPTTVAAPRQEPSVTPPAEPVATDQSESPEDIRVTSAIRSAVVEDSSLSAGAKNCVIVTRGGVVTLRGDVTAAEATTIARHAQAVSGVERVDNQLMVTDQAAQ